MLNMYNSMFNIKNARHLSYKVFYEVKSSTLGNLTCGYMVIIMPI